MDNKFNLEDILNEYSGKKPPDTYEKSDTDGAEVYEKSASPKPGANVTRGSDGADASRGTDGAEVYEKPVLPKPVTNFTRGTAGANVYEKTGTIPAINPKPAAKPAENLGREYVAPDLSGIKIELTAQFSAVPDLASFTKSKTDDVTPAETAETADSAFEQEKQTAEHIINSKNTNDNGDLTDDLSPQEFREKYSAVEYKTADSLDITDAKRRAVTPRKVPGGKRTPARRGFSQKQEISSDYTEERTGERNSERNSERSSERTSEHTFSDKLEEANLYFKSDRYVIEGDATHSKAFTPDRNTDNRIERKPRDSRVADILSEYPEHRPGMLHTLSTTYHKAITGFFTKILPKTETAHDATVDEDIAYDINAEEDNNYVNSSEYDNTPVNAYGGDDDNGNTFDGDYDNAPANAIDTEYENPAVITDKYDSTPAPHVNAMRSEKAGLVSKSDLYNNAGRRYAQKKYNAEPQFRGNIADIDLHDNLGGKIMSSTSQLETAEEAKLRELAARRQEKLKTFRLVGAEEEEQNEADKKAKPQDFESYDNTREVAAALRSKQRSFVISALILFLVTAAGLFLAAVNDWGGLETPEMFNKITNTTVFLVINSILGVIAGVAAFSTIDNGVSKLLDGNPDADTLVSLLLAGSFMLDCAAFTVPNLVKQGHIQILIPVATAALFFNVLGKIMLVKRTRKSFKIFSGAKNKYAMSRIEDIEVAATLTRGLVSGVPYVAAYKETEFATDFLKKSFAPDASDRFAKASMPAIGAVAAVIGVIGGFLSYEELRWDCIFAGFSIFFSAVAVAAGFISLLIVNTPASGESARLNSSGAVLLGYDGAEEFADCNGCLLDAKTLFPHGSVGLLGVKLFSDTRLDEAIVEAASLTHQAGSIVDTMFYDIIRGKTDLLNPVESYIYEDSMGLCGWINNRRVLLGNRELMINHSINGLPSENKEAEYTGRKKSALYLSIAGELSAMFIIDLIPNVEIADALLELERKNINIILRTVDSVLSIAKISDMFDLSPEYIKLLPFRHHELLDSVTAYAPRVSANAVFTGGITGLSSVFTAAKRIRAACFSGLALQMAAMIIGALLLLVMMIFDSSRDISVTFLTAYNLVFVVILALVHSIGRLFP